jgi:hypothetical protein
MTRKRFLNPSGTFNRNRYRYRHRLFSRPYFNPRLVGLILDSHFCLDTKVPKSQDCGKIAPKTDAPFAAISKLARPGKKRRCRDSLKQSKSRPLIPLVLWRNFSKVVFAVSRGHFFLPEAPRSGTKADRGQEPWHSYRYRNRHRLFSRSHSDPSLHGLIFDSRIFPDTADFTLAFLFPCPDRNLSTRSSPPNGGLPVHRSFGSSDAPDCRRLACLP